MPAVVASLRTVSRSQASGSLDGCPITRAPVDLPFRWMVAEGERTRAVTSVSSLLRNVRSAVDPGYRPVRLRIAPLPLDAP